MTRSGVLLLLLLIAPYSGGLASPGSPESGPRVVGHRGLFKHAPEETLANFNACIDLRLDIELDVRRTRDGQLVCLHDDTVDRTTNGTGKVAKLSLREVQQLDVGKKFDSAFAGERIPTLEEVFVLLRDRKANSLMIAVDLKIPDTEADCVRLARKYGVLKQLTFIGLAIEDVKVREKLRDASPDAIAAALCPAAEKLDATIADPTAAWVYLRFIPTTDEVKRIHAAGKKVILVGPLVAGHEPANWAKGRAVGVDAILTDYPLELRAACRGVKK